MHDIIRLMTLLVIIIYIIYFLMYDINGYHSIYLVFHFYVLSTFYVFHFNVNYIQNDEECSHQKIVDSQEEHF